MKWINGSRIFFIFIVCLDLALPACRSFGQECSPETLIEISSTPNPVGSGARALGMGGAFIAIADDATAASWNPGGLIQIEKPELSGVYGYVKRTEKNALKFEELKASWSGSINDLSLNYLSFAWPFEWLERNMIVSLNYQHLHDFNREWRYHIDQPTGPFQYEYEQEGALYALGLAYSAEITPEFSAGLTVNYWGDFIYKNQWNQYYHSRGEVTIGADDFVSVSSKKEEYSFSGWNVNLGFLLRISEQWTLGGVLKTPFTADINRTFVFHETRDYATLTEHNVNRVICDDEYDQELDMPLSYGVGIAYRYSDNFTISTDVYRTHWDDFKSRDEDGNESSPVSGKPIGISDLDPTTCFRLGAEYLVIMDKICVPLRAGVFYDSAPAEGSPDKYVGFSLGSGLYYKRYIFDIAYQYRFGNDVGSSIFQDLDFSQDVREHTVYTSLIVHF